MTNRELLRTVNPLRVVLGAVVETTLSALYAPIMMMMQMRQISEIFVGQDSGWATQSRKHSRTPWPTLLRRHWLQTLAGIHIFFPDPWPKKRHHKRRLLQPAFAHALALGVTTLELDCAVTRDGVVVVSHDALLKPQITRGPDGRWLDHEGPPIWALAYDELQRYDVGRIRPGSAYAKRFFRQHGIPLERFGNVPSPGEFWSRLYHPVAPDRDAGPPGQWRKDRVQAGPVRKVHINGRGRLVHAPPDLRDHLRDDAPKVRVVVEADVRLVEPALALDPDVERAVDHDLRDAVVVEEPLERAVAEDVVRDLGLEAVAVVPRQPRLLHEPPPDVAGDAVSQRAGVDLDVEDLRPELRDDRHVDTVLQLAERVGPARLYRRTAGRESLVQIHYALPRRSRLGEPVDSFAADPLDGAAALVR